MTSNTHQTHRHTDTQTHDLLAGGNGLEVHVGCCVNHRQLQRVVYLCMHACTALRMCPWHGMHTFMSLCLSVCLTAVCKHECMKAFHVSPARCTRRPPNNMVAKWSEFDHVFHILTKSALIHAHTRTCMSMCMQKYRGPPRLQTRMKLCGVNVCRHTIVPGPTGNGKFMQRSRRYLATKRAQKHAHTINQGGLSGYARA